MMDVPETLICAAPVPEASEAGDAIVTGHEMDEASFQALYRQTVGPLRVYAARVLGEATEADDVVQEAYLRLLRHPPGTRDDNELRAYLFRIASNLIVDQWRRRKRETPVARAPEQSTRNRDAALRIDMGRIFQHLRPRDRQLMWLAHVVQADHREIAAALGLRERSVRVLLSRARRKLARLLRDSGHAPRRDSDVGTR